MEGNNGRHYTLGPGTTIDSFFLRSIVQTRMLFQQTLSEFAVGILAQSLIHYHSCRSDAKRDLTRLCRFLRPIARLGQNHWLCAWHRSRSNIICTTVYAVASGLTQYQHPLSRAKKGFMTYEWCLVFAKAIGPC
jgi:hypothetical protein